MCFFTVLKVQCPAFTSVTKREKHYLSLCHNAIKNRLLDLEDNVYIRKNELISQPTVK